ncbi:VOC family protein [Streptomyces sp. MNU89]|uniref:VOC family protein n=1 Tax=Streptomyces sp. MNU89 TaxID=2560025 RepID=UPI001E5C6399|nr:VOC family protein [Streptomyces sp. MNU89]MCC9739911.1 VOC family protein [Streptomyces sp. MNU89]
MAVTSVFVNLPVKDVQRSRAFFGALGYSFDERFSDEKSACLVLKEESIFAMLLAEPFFKGFIRKEIADAASTTEVITALAAESREEVDRLVDTALASGGSPASDTMDEGPMYVRSFQDPDGHHWEVVYMDMSAMQ